MSSRDSRRCLHALSAALGVLLVSATPLLSQTGIITGRVTDAASAAGVSAAQVQLAGLSLGTVTGDDGSYRIVNVPAGSYTLVVRRIGYEERRTPDVVVGTGATITVNVLLDEALKTLSSVAVTGTRNQPEKVLDAPAQISVISSERIAERPAVTISENLKSTVGVDVQQGGIAQSNIVARGFNNAFSGSMLMLQDYRFAGVPSLRVNVPFLFTGTNDDIERMEVLLGPASALYGPNSANGVLHVITKSPFTSQGTTISLDGGERSVIRAGLRHAGSTSEKFAYKLSGEVMRGKDWQYVDPGEPQTFSQFAPEARRGQPNERSFDLEKLTGEARMDIRPRDGMELISTVGFTKAGSGLELTGANGTVQVRDWTYMNLQQRFRWNRLFAQAFVNNSNAGNADASSSEGSYLLRSGQPIVDKSSVSALQVQHGFDMADDRQTFTYGLDYIATKPETGGTINGQNEGLDNVNEYGAYVQSTTRPNSRVELLAALRLDGNNVIEGGFVSPRVALTFKPTPTQNVRMTYNRAFSTPANFSFFLDLIQAPNVGGSGYDVRAFGNKPKEGWSFRRDCTGAFGNLCMKSPLVPGGQYVGASASSAYGPIFQARGAAVTAAITPGIIGALQSPLVGLSAAQAQALGTALGSGIVSHLGGTTPTDAQVGTRVAFIGTAGNLSPTDLTDIAPLDASFNNTYEIGYKGVIGNRATLDIAAWRQQRGDVGTSAALATPNVFFNSTTFQGYTAEQIVAAATPILMSQNFSAEQAAAVAGALAASIAPSLATQFAPAPLGVVTFDGETIPSNVLYATYQSVNKNLWVTGIDLAASFAFTQRLSAEGTFSHMNANVFEGIPGGNSAPLMANSPKNRGTLSLRFEDAERAYTLESRVRMQESYPVNSGVYATNVAFVIPAGNPGAVANASGGYDKCNPAPAGTYCYEDVPDFATLDLQFSKRFAVGAKEMRWSVNAQNIFDTSIRTFPGVPQTGRLVMDPSAVHLLSVRATRYAARSRRVACV